MARLAFLFFMLSILTVQAGFSQSPEAIKRLQTTIDSLQSELEKCQQSTLYRMIDLGKTLPAQAEERPHFEYRKMLIDDLQGKAAPTLPEAVSLTQLVDEFTSFCDQLREEIISRTGGYDQNNKPFGLANKDEVTKLFLVEKQAELLRNKMTELRAAMLRISSNQIDEDQIASGAPLEKETDKSWEEYTFRNMPTAAVLPLLAKFRNDALRDEITTLTYLIEKN